MPELAAATSAPVNPDAAGAAAGSSTIPPPASLDGAYRVAGVDEDEIDLAWGVSAEIKDGQILLESQCIRPLWRYTYSDGSLATERTPSPMCRRALMPIEQRAIRAIDTASRVERTPSNALVLTGGEGSVTLFSQ